MSLFAQTDLNGELVVEIHNPSTSVFITVNAEGVVWGSKNDNYPVTHDFDHFEVFAAAFDADHVDSPTPRMKHLVMVDTGLQSQRMGEISFDAGHLASGVYWYRLQAGATSHVKKMILAK